MFLLQCFFSMTSQMYNYFILYLDFIIHSSCIIWPAFISVARVSWLVLWKCYFLSLVPFLSCVLLHLSITFCLPPLPSLSSRDLTLLAELSKPNMRRLYVSFNSCLLRTVTSPPSVCHTLRKIESVCVHESVCTCPAVTGASLLGAGGWRGHSPEWIHQVCVAQINTHKSNI